MKKVFKITKVLLALVLISAFSSCEKDDATPILPKTKADDKAVETKISKGKDFVDSRDKKIYPTVVIGTQTWMAKNLSFNVSKKSFAYKEDIKNVDKYGYLYTWESLNEAIPKGWHLPTDKEWQELEKTLGMSAEDLKKEGYENKRGKDQGTSLKEGGKSLLNIPMAGFRGEGEKGASFEALENRTYLWVDSKKGDDVYRRRIVKAEPYVYRFTNPSAGFAISVRLIKDK